MKKRIATFLDDRTPSTIHFEGDSHYYGDGRDHEEGGIQIFGDNTPDITLQFRDCRHSVTFHDWGNTREAMNNKFDKMISALQSCQKDANELWTDWEIQREEKRKNVKSTSS